MKAVLPILLVVSWLGAAEARADSASADSSRQPAGDRANALLISTSSNMPLYWLLYQIEFWQINLDYHRRLNRFWELQGLLSLARMESPEMRYWYPTVGLAGVRYLRARRHGFYFGGLLLLEFTKAIFKDWDMSAEVFEPGLYLLAGYKHVFRSGFCINFAIAPGIRVSHSFSFAVPPLNDEVDVQPEAMTCTRYTLGMGWAF